MIDCKLDIYTDIYLRRLPREMNVLLCTGVVIFYSVALFMRVFVSRCVRVSARMRMRGCACVRAYVRTCVCACVCVCVCETRRREAAAVPADYGVPGAVPESQSPASPAPGTQHHTLWSARRQTETSHWHRYEDWLIAHMTLTTAY